MDPVADVTADVAAAVAAVVAAATAVACMCWASTQPNLPPPRPLLAQSSAAQSWPLQTL